jgi:hypothetical protein
LERTLNHKNIDSVICAYVSSINEVGAEVSDLKGVDLFVNLKRGKVGVGPYPKVSLFEAANRIMTDLVILKAVKYLLNSNTLPFDEYIVEYGHEDQNSHDITSTSKNGEGFAGEAFNVAPSFYQGKKRATKKKLQDSKFNANHKFIIANLDAVSANYHPLKNEGVNYLFVDINSDFAQLFSDN